MTEVRVADVVRRALAQTIEDRVIENFESFGAEHQISRFAQELQAELFEQSEIHTFRCIRATGKLDQ
jgi:hypothetical protein